jgi:short-subunit dehydrogenase involved in D-alanine esterification of teichoic acids
MINERSLLYSYILIMFACILFVLLQYLQISREIALPLMGFIFVTSTLCYIMRKNNEAIEISVSIGLAFAFLVYTNIIS